MLKPNWKSKGSNSGCLIGHRGAPEYCPENTLESFKYAIEAGLDAIELDVWLVEGRLVVFHDSSVHRMTGHIGELPEMSLQTLRSLRVAGSLKIPFLEEVFELCKSRCSINIELKGPGTECAVQEAITEACRKGWNKNQFLVSSFDHDALLRLREIDNSVLLGLLTEDTERNLEETVAAVNPYSIHIWNDVLDEEYLHYLKKFNRSIFVYTVNDASRCRWLYEKGIDRVFTDNPYLMNSLETASSH